ncbi:MAG: DUF2852 domain-containing protein [Pseudomonadota bacterium]
MTDQPTGLRIVSLVLFTGFAIPVSIVALVKFWPAGVALAAFFGWQWTRLAGVGAGPRIDDLIPNAPAHSTGNASFDAYRAELMDRLEAERTEFEEFLTRLRAAKDKSEFDRFMEARANA